MKLAAALLLFAAAASGATSRISGACDIATTPAATLLLPYFDVDVAHTPPARTTLVSIVNVSPRHVIDRVTLWTDYGYPLLSFNLGMNGYGTDSFDLREVLTTGHVARHGRLCPATDIPDAARREALTALTTGRLGDCNSAGNQHFNSEAIGYATIDVVANCHARTPASADYFTRDLRFDNVLTGDYETIANERDADGSPLVHIRAADNLPYTFYDRMTGGITPRGVDRRQPLPSLFAARFGTPDDEIMVWMESLQGRERPCLVKEFAFEADVFRFDEHENTALTYCVIEGCIGYHFYAATSSPLRRSDYFPFPPWPSDDAGGWIYLNLNAPNQPAHFSTKRAAQGWVVVRHRASSARAALVNAAWIANGCSPAVPSDSQIGAKP